VALSDIEVGTELLFCPWKLVLGTEGDMSNVPAEHCDVLRSYAKEGRACKGSFGYSYLAMGDGRGSRVPAVSHELILEELQGTAI
jgi:hypothetical protein